MRKGIPFVAFGNDELRDLPDAYEGQIVQCSKCCKRHRLESGIEGKTKKKSHDLFFYKCGKSAYLGAVGGKLVTGLIN